MTGICERWWFEPPQFLPIWGADLPSRANATMTREHTSCHFLDGRVARWHKHCTPFIIISLFSFLILFTHRIFFCEPWIFRNKHTTQMIFSWYWKNFGLISNQNLCNVQMLQLCSANTCTTVLAINRDSRVYDLYWSYSHSGLSDHEMKLFKHYFCFQYIFIYWM